MVAKWVSKPHCGVDFGRPRVDFKLVITAGDNASNVLMGDP
jgi:hypothetical protein